MAALTGRALGLVLIFLTAIIWVAASFVSQLLVTNEEGRTNFNVPPFLLTYLSTSVFTIFLPLVQLKSLLQETWLLRRSFKYKPLQDDEESAHLIGPNATSAHPAAAEQHSSQRSSPACRAGGGGAGGLTADLEVAEAAAAAEAASAAVRASRAAHKEALTAAAQCFLLWFVAQFLFNQSLKLTSVTSNTILSSTSSLFTFALSMVFLREPYSVAKLLSIAACIGGTLLVTLSDDSSGGSSSNVRGSSLAATIAAGSNATAAATPGNSGGSTEPSHSVWGDMLCLVSAAFYACYTIVLRKALPDDDEANVALFFGYVGLLCSVVFAPVVAVLAGVGALHIKAIPSKAYLIILVQGVLNYCLSDYLWAHAVLLLGPTIATLGLSVQIPVAAVVEAIIGHPKWLSTGASIAMTLSGTALIMLGFVAGNLAVGGHVYGSHHRDGQVEECSSPGGLADDSFTDQRHSPVVARAALNGSSHNHNGCSHPRRGSSDSGSHGNSDLPQSPLLNPAKAQQQGSAATGGLAMPVSTHARVVPLENDGSPRSSIQGRPLGGARSSTAAAAAGAAAATGGDGSSPAGSSGGRSPRKAALGTRQLLPLSRQQLQQEEEQHVGSSDRPASRPSQQWESIELSSSFGSDGNKSEQHTPPGMSALRPREQLQSPLGFGQTSSPQANTAVETAGNGANCIPSAAAHAEVG